MRDSFISFRGLVSPDELSVVFQPIVDMATGQLFANEALVRLLAEALKVPERSVRVVAGATSRSKVVEVDGTTADAVRALASAGET